MLQTAGQLIDELSKLPRDRMVLVNVPDIGFIGIIEIDDDPSDPGALINLETGEAIDIVREINAQDGPTH